MAFSLQEEGRAAYRRKDYRNALSHFNRAVSREPSSVRLLDNRAACHEKLGEFSTGLKDAKKAIQLQREDPTGYLRAGRILIKMDKQPVALEIYSHGLKSVKHVGQGYEILRKAHNELQSQLCPPKSVDPFTILPRELATQILEYLTFKQQMSACLVSQQWTRFIRSVPDLWRDLNLSGARRKVRNAFISRAINTGRSKLRRATLMNVENLEKTVNALVSHCGIEEITLLDTGIVDPAVLELLQKCKTLKSVTLGSGTTTKTDVLRCLLQSTPAKIERLMCNHVEIGSTSPIRDLKNTYLKELIVHSVSRSIHPIRDMEFAILPSRSLQTLRIDCLNNTFDLLPFHLGHLEHLAHLHLSINTAKWNFRSLPPSIRTLKLSSNLRHQYLTCAAELPQLEHLSLDLPQIAVGTVFYLLTEHRSSPEESDALSDLAEFHTLELSGCEDTSVEEFEELQSLKRFEKIRKLSFTQYPHQNIDKLVGYWASVLENLQSLDISNTKISGVGVRQIVEGCRLKHLIVNDCESLGRDAVDWARSRGVQVDFGRKSVSSSSGRKVRY